MKDDACLRAGGAGDSWPSHLYELGGHPIVEQWPLNGVLLWLWKLLLFWEGVCLSEWVPLVLRGMYWHWTRSPGSNLSPHSQRGSVGTSAGFCRPLKLLHKGPTPSICQKMWSVRLAYMSLSPVAWRRPFPRTYRLKAKPQNSPSGSVCRDLA